MLVDISRLVAWVAVPVLAVLLFVSGMVLPALPHEAIPTAAQPLGWQYPVSCCSGIDCARAQPGEVEEIKGGYRIVPSGDFVAFKDTRIKDSPDGEFHICRVGGDPKGKTLCLFVPPPAT